MKEQEKVRTYTHGDVTVEWRAHKCIHSEICWHGLPRVFNPKERPWIRPENASSDSLIAQVHRCPSGALSIAGEERVTPSEMKGIIAEKSPQEVVLEKEKRYAWCACGRSDKQPFCDGTHQETDLRPMVFKADGEKAWLCRCKQTSNPPYCDGTHNTL